MTIDELVGGALVDCTDPVKASRHLLAALLSPTRPTKAELSGTELDVELVDSLRRELTGGDVELAVACARGAAWAMGRQSGLSDDSWEPVLTGDAPLVLPAGIQRTTAETMTSLINAARSRVRFVAPFFDVSGASFLAEPLAAATSRGVDVELYLPPDLAAKRAPVNVVVAAVRRDGAPERFRVFAASTSGPWPHLKVMVSDSSAAYVGSANITEKGLREGNLEFGVLLTGPQVAIIDGVIDLIRAELVSA